MAHPAILRPAPDGWPAAAAHDPEGFAPDTTRILRPGGSAEPLPRIAGCGWL